MKSFAVGGLLVALLVGLTQPSASAQRWIVEASAGAAEYDALAGEVGSTNVIVGARREGRVWTAAYGGIPVDSAAVPWIAGGAGGRWSAPVRGLQAGLDGGLLGYGFRAGQPGRSGGGATVWAMPFVGRRAGILHLEGYAGATHHATRFDGDAAGRTLVEGGVRSAVVVADRLSLISAGRVVRAEEAVYPYAGGRMEMARGTAAAWVSAGRWLHDELDDSEWGVGVRFGLPAALTLRASYERAANDPLYWNGARSAWSIGLSRAFGGTPAAVLERSAREAVYGAGEEIVLRVTAEEAGEGVPLVAGDFTGWEPIRMKRVAGGWEARFTLAEGMYRFAFRREAGQWFLPERVRSRADDGFGGENGVLMVVSP